MWERTVPYKCSGSGTLSCLTAWRSRAILCIGGSYWASPHQGNKSAKEVLDCIGSGEPLPCIPATYHCEEKEVWFREVVEGQKL